MTFYLSPFPLIVNININTFNKKVNYYVVHYYDVPENIKTYFLLGQTRNYHSDSIVEWAKDEKDLEIYINIKKYNL